MYGLFVEMCLFWGDFYRKVGPTQSPRVTDDPIKYA